MMDRWFPRKANLKVTQAPRNWGVRRKKEYCKNEKGKEKGKHITSTDHPHKNKKIRGGFKKKKKKKKSGLLNHPLSLPGNHCAAWCCLYHCGTYQRRQTEGLGNGVAMATKRSTRDVKAQRGLGRGKREKGKEEKVYVRLQLLCFPMKKGPGEMERDRVRWQLLSAATTSGSQSAQPGETTHSMQPWPSTQQGWDTNACRLKHHWKYSQSMLFN